MPNQFGFDITPVEDTTIVVSESSGREFTSSMKEKINSLRLVHNSDESMQLSLLQRERKSSRREARLIKKRAEVKRRNTYNQCCLRSLLIEYAVYDTPLLNLPRNVNQRKAACKHFSFETKKSFGKKKRKKYENIGNGVRVSKKKRAKAFFSLSKNKRVLPQNLCEKAFESHPDLTLDVCGLLFQEGKYDWRTIWNQRPITDERALLISFPHRKFKNIGGFVKFRKPEKTVRISSKSRNRRRPSQLGVYKTSGLYKARKSCAKNRERKMSAVLRKCLEDFVRTVDIRGGTCNPDGGPTFFASTVDVEMTPWSPPATCGGEDHDQVSMDAMDVDELCDPEPREAICGQAGLYWDIEDV